MEALSNAQIAGANASNVANAGVGYAITTDIRFVIPLKFLSAFFRPVVEDMLIPAGLASGLRIELTLSNDISRIFTISAGTITGYTVSDPVMLIQHKSPFLMSRRMNTHFPHISGPRFGPGR